MAMVTIRWAGTLDVHTVTARASSKSAPVYPAELRADRIITQLPNAEPVTIEPEEGKEYARFRLTAEQWQYVTSNAGVLIAALADGSIALPVAKRGSKAHPVPLAERLAAFVAAQEASQEASQAEAEGKATAAASKRQRRS